MARVLVILGCGGGTEPDIAVIRPEMRLEIRLEIRGKRYSPRGTGNDWTIDRYRRGTLELWTIIAGVNGER